MSGPEWRLEWLKAPLPGHVDLSRRLLFLNKQPGLHLLILNFLFVKVQSRSLMKSYARISWGLFPIFRPVRKRRLDRAKRSLAGQQCFFTYSYTKR